MPNAIADSQGKSRNLLAATGFLAPNFIGFALFTLLPVILSFCMAFTSWSLKPAVVFRFLGLRNFSDLLWFQPLADPRPEILAATVLSAAAAILGAVGALWANAAGWKGIKWGGLVLTLLGLGSLCVAVGAPAGQGAFLVAAIMVACGVATLAREDADWGWGRGALPSLALAAGAIGLALSLGPFTAAYVPRDSRFWQYFYNTAYLMIGIPFSIAGSLGLALLLNEDLPVGRSLARGLGTAACLAGGAATLGVLWALGSPDLAALGAIFWGLAALGIAFNMVAFRTIFYLPSFTAGVALMILWKALYNPETGPINLGLESLFRLAGWNVKGPLWLASVAWAKPALILMGVWIGIGGTNMLLYLAGLSNIPGDLLDAAKVDGAGRWQRFRHVIWPQLAPTTFFISIMSIIGGLQGGFEQARVMTGGGPAGSTTTLSYYIYQKAFLDLDLGYAAAISWILFAIIFIATAINWKFGRDLEVES